MKRLILALSVLATPALATAVQTLPDCPTGWRNSRMRCLPTTSVSATQSFGAAADAGPNAIYVKTLAGNILAMLDGGQAVTFNCYALPATVDPSCGQ